VATHKVILQGGGEHARVVLDCLLSQEVEVLALFDPKYNGHLFNVPQLGVYDPTYEPEAKAIIAIGDNALRKRVALLTKHLFANIVHSSSIFSQQAFMGTGNMILHGTIVQANSNLGNHIIVNTGATIDHDCKLGDYVHIAPGAILCGTVTVGEGSFIGAGAIITPGRKIGSWSIVGAGAVVIHDVQDNTVVAGNPARIIKRNVL
jgi:sugar O-acyltransferase (sialic acid O-acetyltransferase NeuD family)